MASASWTLTILATILLATTIFAVPVDHKNDQTTVESIDDGLPTLATELKPPPPPSSERLTEGGRPAIVYVVNLYAVKNTTAESSEEMLKNEVIEKIPDVLEPVATLLFVVELDNEDEPVSLDEIASDLEREGFKVEKIDHDGETSLVKVEMENRDVEEIEAVSTKPNPAKPERLKKLRFKRAPCFKCKKGGGGGGYGYPSGGGGYGYPQTGGYGGGHGGGGGGYVVLVPSSGGYGGYGGGRPVQTGGGGYCPSCQPVQPCNTCGNSGHGGGGGGSYSQASASAQASSSSWGRK